MVLSAHEVVGFLEAIPGLKHRAALTTAYATGLRASETVSLQVGDIDSARMPRLTGQGGQGPLSGDRLVGGVVTPGRHVRQRGALLLARGRMLDPVAITLAASAGVAHLDVTRRPRIGVFSGGDELAEPGGVASCDQIFEAGSFAICGLIDHWGGQARRLPIVRDSAVAVAEAAASAQRHADLLVIIGGASVGPHDHARSALRGLGVEIAFDKIAVRPGKPTWFGVSPAGPVLGLPGNPASAIMCARLLLRPLVEKMLARNAADAAQQRVSLLMAPLGAGLPGNGARESYLRGHLDERGVLHQFDDQDSSLLSVFAKTNTLIVRPANAAAACAGDIVGCLSFP